MNKCLVGGVALLMATFCAFGNANRYCAIVSTAYGLLQRSGTNVVEVSRATTNGNGLVCQTYRFGTTNLWTASDCDGVIVAMRCNGEPIELEIPDMELRGEPEWVRWSKFYNHEILRRVAFTRFFSPVPSGKEVDSVAVACVKFERIAEITNLSSGRYRMLNAPDQWELWHMYDELARDSASLSYSSKNSYSFSSLDFSASFYANGGLRRLSVSNAKYGETMRWKEWNVTGKLIRDVDFRKVPPPKIKNISDLHLRKGDRLL